MCSKSVSRQWFTEKGSGWWVFTNTVQKGGYFSSFAWIWDICSLLVSDRSNSSAICSAKKCVPFTQTVPAATWSATWSGDGSDTGTVSTAVPPVSHTWPGALLSLWFQRRPSKHWPLTWLADCQQPAEVWLTKIIKTVWRCAVIHHFN